MVKVNHERHQIVDCIYQIVEPCWTSQFPEETDLHKAVKEPLEGRGDRHRFQKIICDQRKIPSASKHSPYLLTGLVECQLCGTKMYGYTYTDSRKEGRVYQSLRWGNITSIGRSIPYVNLL